MSVPSQLDRRAAVAALLKDRNNMLVVSGLGSPTYDLHSIGDHDGNFYLWGAMGGAALIGLGLAQAQPGKRVIALTGDGEQLMGLGGIATIGVARPGNLDIVVIDNQHFGETGMQASHTGRGVDLTAIATACGFATTGTVRTLEEVQRLASDIAKPADGPRLFVIKVRAENPPRSLPSRDAVFIKNRFRAHLGFAAA
ncbi:thiamine pyrophosphate-dependent enzyme [Bradyrhizobium sp. GCM10027634]|uniref:thiamine pyrophosphate-dependent enzyme n=1 Tax=unclassified Bradyrhizobium TaxID=2631580 RepID=UPI00188C2883|nr:MULTISPECIES: thiamine pyrophosphate-dependent enzyme [unclassified Bradyrhizobium]MDN4999762.1 thiamine pyrophosphate-dependent enzyme [Bradyrhizobium sp. WYCCWR 12677]QOZ43336.1 aldehyde dehydrogenase [Bradyrhizobium sp. CCBAU 53340]